MFPLGQIPLVLVVLSKIPVALMNVRVGTVNSVELPKLYGSVSGRLLVADMDGLAVTLGELGRISTVVVAELEEFGWKVLIARVKVRLDVPVDDGGPEPMGLLVLPSPIGELVVSTEPVPVTTVPGIADVKVTADEFQPVKDEVILRPVP